MGDKTQYHIVWVTRYRKKILVPGVARYLHVKLEAGRRAQVVSGLGRCCHRERDRPLASARGDPPKYAVSFMVETLKKNTSRALAEKFVFLRAVDRDGKGIRTPGDFVSTVGVNEAIIRRDVEMQGQESAGQAELEC